MQQHRLAPTEQMLFKLLNGHSLRDLYLELIVAKGQVEGDLLEAQLNHILLQWAPDRNARRELNIAELLERPKDCLRFHRAVLVVNVLFIGFQVGAAEVDYTAGHKYIALAGTMQNGKIVIRLDFKLLGLGIDLRLGL